MSKDEKSIKVLMVEPGKMAYEAEIPNTLESLHHVVGGYIQAVYPFHDMVALVCNEEGKNLRLPLNRVLVLENGKVYDLIAGTFFVCGLDEENFASLSPTLMTKYKAMFLEPEVFEHINGTYSAIKVTPEYYTKIYRPLRDRLFDAKAKAEARNNNRSSEKHIHDKGLER